ncbi:DNA repair exonuclease, partial [Bacillus inaquosorum]|nr:DNA repair exonuclease [Bacillus inaquosorum]
AEEEHFIWPLSLEDETEKETNLTNLDPFFGGLFEDIDGGDLSDVLEGLERHPVYRRHADRFSQEELKEIKEQAQILLKRQLKVLET